MSTEPGAPASNQGGGGGGPPAGGTSTLRLGMKKMEGGGQGGVGEAESLELASREEKGSTKEARSGRGGRKEGGASLSPCFDSGWVLFALERPPVNPCLPGRPPQACWSWRGLGAGNEDPHQGWARTASKSMCPRAGSFVAPARVILPPGSLHVAYPTDSRRVSNFFGLILSAKPSP